MPDAEELSAPSVVIVLKKFGGSFWRETARTGTCPTPEWLEERYGTGEYELRLKRGNRMLCMVAVSAGDGGPVVLPGAAASR